MRILVVHPKDKSTEFLTKVYENLEVTLVQGGVSQNELRNMIEDHDQVILLGHGTPHGLMSVGQFPNTNGFVIDDTFAPLLKEKDNTVFIWCNADQYVKYNDLQGFYTGMFISEVSEAYMMGVRGADQAKVNESNETFVALVSKVVNLSASFTHRFVREKYGELRQYNPVVRYNHERLYVS